MSNLNLINYQNYSSKKNIEVTTRIIFDIKIKTNNINYIILNELNGFQSIFYLKNKKLEQLFLKTKKKKELEILKNYEIIYLDSNLNHNSLICLTSNGCIFSINYESHRIIYFSNLDFNKFIIPNVIFSKKRSFSFSRKSSNKANTNDNLNQIYNIYCNNSSDKIVLNLKNYILFWYQSNYNKKITDYSSKIESVSGTIYSLIKENEIEKCGIINNSKNKINNIISNSNNVIAEGVITIFVNNFFLGSHTRIFFVILVSNDNDKNNKKTERQLYIMDYLFKFNYKDRFRCISDIPRNDFFLTDLFNGAENEDLNDIKSKISTTSIIYNNSNQNKNKKESKSNNENNKINQLLMKANIKGDTLAIIVSDNLENPNILNINSTLIFFMTETYKFRKKKIIDIIGTTILTSKSIIILSEMDWICNDMFLLILTSKGYFFLVNINFQLVYISDISNSIKSYETYYISNFFEINNKNNITGLKLFVPQQREDIFMIYTNDYSVCYQINYKTFENKIITSEIPPDNFSNFLFLLKYFQLYLSTTQIDYLQENELNLSILDIMHKYIQGLFNKVKDNNIPLQIEENDIIKTETGIKIMKTKQNDTEYQDSVMGEANEINQKNVDENNKMINNQMQLMKSETNNNLLKNIVRYIQIFRSLNQVHEKNLALVTFLIGKSTDFLVHLINHKEIWLAVLFLELCEKYLCKELLLFKNIGENNFNYNIDLKNKYISLSKIIFKSKQINAYNSERYISFFFDIFQNFQKAPINKGIYSRMRLLLLFFCLIEFRNNFALNINVLFFVLAKLIIEKMKQKDMLDDVYSVAKVIIKNFKYLKQENDKVGKDEFILSSLSMSYRNEFFSELKITKTERDDINFDFFAEFYTIDDFASFTEPSDNFCKTDDLFLLSEFNYLNNTGVLQKWVILMTNYLFYDLFQDIKKYMDNHLRQVKDKSEANTSPEEKSLTKLVFFNMVFILQYIQTFLKDIILFLTKKEPNQNIFNNNDYNNNSNNSENGDKENENNSNIEISNNFNINQNNDNDENENMLQDNYTHYNDKMQDDFNKILFKSISPIDVPFIIFTFYIYETNPNNKSKAYDINKELTRRIIENSRQCLFSIDDLLELIEFIHLNGFNYIDNNINSNIIISQIIPKERIQNSIFTSFLFYFFIMHKLNLIYLLENDLDLIYSVLDSLNLNQRKQLYEIILIIVNGTLKYFLKMQFNQKISPVEGKYLEILLNFYKIIFYKMIREESCFVRKNITDFVRISPSIMSSYLLEGALHYEYKNCNKICKNIIGLDKIILNNMYITKKIDKKMKIPNTISIFEILYGLSGIANNNNMTNNSGNIYGKDKKIYRQIIMILFNNDKLISKQFLILLNNLTKLIQIRSSHSIYSNHSSPELLIFKLENDLSYIKEIIQSKITKSKIDKNEEEEISNNIYSIIDLIIKGNFDDRTLFKFNNMLIKSKLIRNLKLVISKILHLLHEIQIKINLLLFEDKGNLQSKINYLNLLSQGLLCEKNPKIVKKIVNDIFSFIKLLNIKKIINNNKNNNDIKEQFCNIIKNIEIAIIMNFSPEYEKSKISELLGQFGFQLTDIINFDEISNLGKIVMQIISNKLKKFLFYGGIGIPNYLENIKLIYKDLLTLIKTRQNEKLLIKARRQYIQLSDSFYNIVGIPQKCFIEFINDWELVEKEQLYQSIIADELDDHLYCEEKTGILLNKRQTTGKETPKKIRKNSVSKFKKEKEKNIKNNLNIINVEDDENNNNIIVGKDSEIKYRKTVLKIKKEREISLNSNNNYENNLIYFKNTVRKIILNRFIYNLFIDINVNSLEKEENTSFKIYSISPRMDSKKEKEDSKNVEGDKNLKLLKETNIFGNLKEMNLTAVERKKIHKIPNKIITNEKNSDKFKNIKAKKIEQKKFGIKNNIGTLGNNMKSNISNTISLSSKLSDISEKLDKYENLINKLGKEFQ